MPSEANDKPPLLFNIRKMVYAALVLSSLSVLHKAASLFLFGEFRWDIWWTLPIDLWVLTGHGVTTWRYRFVHHSFDDVAPLCQDRFDSFPYLGLRYQFLYRGHNLTDYPSRVTCPLCRNHPQLPKSAPTRFGMI